MQNSKAVIGSGLTVDHELSDRNVADGSKSNAVESEICTSAFKSKGKGKGKDKAYGK